MNGKRFDRPFACILYNVHCYSYCSHCLRCPVSSNDKLSRCANCRLARYCDRECQKQAWIRDHKAECPRLKTAFPNLPLTDVLFLARVIERLNWIKTRGDTIKVEEERRFDELMTHEHETRQDQQKMARFEKMYEKTKIFVEGTGQTPMPGKEEFFMVFCRVWINSHSIHAGVGMTEIGMALDLGISRYDHNCRPNATLVFDGFGAVLRPLTPTLNPSDYTSTFISYVDVGRSKYQRRHKLWSQWYFWCQCERCMDPDDDKLTSIKCSNVSCPEPVIIREDSESTDVVCSRCNSNTPEEIVIRAQQFMRTVPAKLPSIMQCDDDLEKCRSMLDQASTLLHPDNIYLCRLITAYTEMTNGTDSERSSVQSLITVYNCYKKCYPANHRHVAYHLLHLIRILIERGERAQAVPYAYQAMNILEVSFGIDHPYYLKTLALWTFLDTSADKTKEELIELMNFNYNRPVNIASLME